LTTSEEKNPELRREIITLGELAEFLRLHPSMRSHSSTIYRLLRRGEFRAFKVDSKWAISRESIDRLVDESGK
jgi:hypothetical protein